MKYLILLMFLLLNSCSQLTPTPIGVWQGVYYSNTNKFYIELEINKDEINFQSDETHMLCYNLDDNDKLSCGSHEFKIDFSNENSATLLDVKTKKTLTLKKLNLKGDWKENYDLRRIFYLCDNEINERDCQDLVYALCIKDKTILNKDNLQIEDEIGN